MSRTIHHRDLKHPKRPRVRDQRAALRRTIRQEAAAALLDR